MQALTLRVRCATSRACGGSSRTAAAPSRTTGAASRAWPADHGWRLRRAAEQRLLRHLRVPPAGDRPARSTWSRSTTSSSRRRWSAPCRGIDPDTGNYYDDTADATSTHAALYPTGERRQVFEGNVRRVFPRLVADRRPHRDRMNARNRHVVVRDDRTCRPSTSSTRWRADRHGDGARGDRPTWLRSAPTSARSSTTCGSPGRPSPCRAIPATTS